MSNQTDGKVVQLKETLSVYIAESVEIEKDLEPAQARLLLSKSVNELKTKGTKNASTSLCRSSSKSQMPLTVY